MSRLKNTISRLTLSTVSLAIIAGVGGFAGAIIGGVFSLMSLALFSTQLPAMEVMGAFMIVGTGTAFLWGLRVVLESARPSIPVAPTPTDTQPIPLIPSN